jgi:hypothetical protein
MFMPSVAPPVLTRFPFEPAGESSCGIVSGTFCYELRVASSELREDCENNQELWLLRIADYRDITSLAARHASPEGVIPSVLFWREEPAVFVAGQKAGPSLRSG